MQGQKHQGSSCSENAVQPPRRTIQDEYANRRAIFYRQELLPESCLVALKEFKLTKLTDATAVSGIADGGASILNSSILEQET